MKRLLRAKKGQLFIIEAFIAVSVMIIMVTALYEVQLATQPSPTPTYHEEVYSALLVLDANNIFDDFIFSIDNALVGNISYYRNVIETAIYTSLPDNGEFKLYCEDYNLRTVISESWINQYLTPSDNVIGIDYLISEVDGEYRPCVFHLQVWLKGV